MVVDPDFLESYRKKPCALFGVSVPMMRIELWFAPTVPSAPSPKKSARTVFAGSMLKSGSKVRLVCVTSSLIPTVK